MTHLRKRILPTLAVLAVACAQVFGMQRGFECDHQGTVMETKAEHCHRVAEAEKVAFAPCADDSKDCSEQDNTEHHTGIIVEMKASTAGLVAVSIPAFVAVLIAEIPVHEWVLLQALSQNEMMRMPLDTGGESPPAAVHVAHCVVMLV